MRNIKIIERILEKAAYKYQIKIYRKAIQSNHIHLIVKVPSKKLYKAFVAVIAGKIASYSMGQMSYKNFVHYLNELNGVIHPKGLSQKRARGKETTKRVK